MPDPIAIGPAYSNARDILLMSGLRGPVISNRYPNSYGSRGAEYDRVYIDPDVATSLSKLGGPSANEFGDEANIGYVAFTWPIRDLYIPNIQRPISGSKRRL